MYKKYTTMQYIVLKFLKKYEKKFLYILLLSQFKNLNLNIK